MLSQTETLSDYHRNFAIAIPASIASRPKLKLSMLYRIKVPTFPLCISLMFSSAKVENVVNPPHIPVIKNSLHSFVNQLYFNDSAYSSPTKKHPEIFIRKVDSGNEEG